jgi:hypothetical protein
MSGAATSSTASAMSSNASDTQDIWYAKEAAARAEEKATAARQQQVQRDRGAASKAVHTYAQTPQSSAADVSSKAPAEGASFALMMDYYMVQQGVNYSADSSDYRAEETALLQDPRALGSLEHQFAQDESGSGLSNTDLQGLVHDGEVAAAEHVDGLRIRRGVAEALHHEVGREAQAGKILQFVAGHRAGGVLAADGGHLRLAVGAGADALAFTQAAGAADHLLRQREALAGIGRRIGQAESGRVGQTEELARLGSQRAADNQVDAAAGAHLVEQHIALEREVGDRRAVLLDLAAVRKDVDHVAHLQPGNVHLDRRAGVLLRVEEDRRDLATQRHAPEALVRNDSYTGAAGTVGFWIFGSNANRSPTSVIVYPKAA